MRERENRIRFYLNDGEFAELMKNVERSGLPRGTYLRELVNGTRPKETPPAEFFEVLQALRQINDRLTQIAAKASEENSGDAAAYWENVTRLQRCVGRMIEAMYG